MPDTYRLKIKIGNHEFEAEGDPQVVHEQFQIFKELVGNAPPDIQSPTANSPFRPSLHPSLMPATDPMPPLPMTPPETPAVTEIPLEKIMRQEDRVVSLTVRAANAEDAILLLLLGQKMLRGNDAVKGNEVMSGISSTGGLSIQRSDRLLEKLARDGDVIIFGEHRAKRYRLTNTGLNRARSIAADIAAKVA